MTTSPLQALLFLTGLLLLVSCTLPREAQWAPPHPIEPAVHQLDNGHLRATVLLPDHKRGSYRGARFASLGIVSQVELGGRTFLGELRRGHHDPYGEGHAQGLVEEFGQFHPLGFDSIGLGGTFFKVGVGNLKKDKSEYLFFKPQRLLERAPTSIEGEATPLSIAFHQDHVAERGHAWFYRKVLELHPTRPILSIHHELRNTGWVNLETSHYNHNMFQVDGDPIGANYRIDLEADVPSPGQSHNFEVKGREVTLAMPTLKGHAHVNFPIPSGNTIDGSFQLLHLPTGSRIDSRLDHAAGNLQIYAEKNAICPEPRIQLSLKPGETLHWTQSLEFHAPGRHPINPNVAER